jgi:hypothetical protein
MTASVLQRFGADLAGGLPGAHVPGVPPGSPVPPLPVPPPVLPPVSPEGDPPPADPPMTDPGRAPPMVEPPPGDIVLGRPHCGGPVLEAAGAVARIGRSRRPDTASRPPG